MASLPILLLSITIKLHRAIRNRAYAEMNHIAASWGFGTPTDRSQDKPGRTIRIDLSPPRSLRLILANRRIGSLPY